jgi:hypothetical protein
MRKKCVQLVNSARKELSKTAACTHFCKLGVIRVCTKCIHSTSIHITFHTPKQTSYLRKLAYLYTVSTEPITTTISFMNKKPLISSWRNSI